MFSFSTVMDVIISIFTVVPYTLLLALVILLFGIFLATLIAFVREYNIPVLRSLAVFYVSLVRGIPLLVQLLIVYYALPDIFASLASLAGHNLDPNSVSPVFSVIMAYSLYQAAIQSENIRGALKSVEFGQIEAGYSIGMTTFQVLRRFVVPQALIVSIPSFCNGYVSTIKGLSLAFTVSVVDILAKAKLASALNFRYIESYLAAALVYWGLCLILTQIFYRLEKRLRKGNRQVTQYKGFDLLYQVFSMLKKTIKEIEEKIS